MYTNNHMDLSNVNKIKQKFFQIITPVLALVLIVLAAYAVAHAATTPFCKILAEDEVVSGDLFKLKMVMRNADSGKLRNSAGEVIGSTKVDRKNVGAFASNNLGVHTFVMSVEGLYGTATCSKDVTFSYAPEPVQGYDIVIVAGQSNAEGRGLGEFTDSLEKGWIDDSIVQIGRFGESNMQVIPVGSIAADRIKYDGLHFWDASNATDTKMGFALSFARQYVKRGDLEEGRKVLIIPAAQGGTSITKWLEKDEGQKEFLYQDMIDRFEVAKNLPGEHRVVAFFWQQGEKDVSKTLIDSETMSGDIYEQYLRELFKKVREDISITGNDAYPILAGFMVPGWRADNERASKAKDDIQKAIGNAIRDEGFASLVSSNALLSNVEAGASEDDFIHFSAQSQVNLGYRYYSRWAKIMESESLSEKEVQQYLLEAEYTE